MAKHAKYTVYSIIWCHYKNDCELMTGCQSWQKLKPQSRFIVMWSIVDMYWFQGSLSLSLSGLLPLYNHVYRHSLRMVNNSMVLPFLHLLSTLTIIPSLFYYYTGYHFTQEIIILRICITYFYDFYQEV